MSLSSSIARHFRQSHIAMTPALAPKLYLKTLLLNRKKVDHRTIPFPLNLPSIQIKPTFNGSAALYQAAKQLNVSKGDAVLLPAYCCGAEIGPFHYLQCVLHFYEVDSELNADVQQIEQILNRHKNIKLLLITHYLGFAQIATKEIQQLCEITNTLLLEDCAHAMYGTQAEQPLGSFGHCAIFSPRKTVELTEGGLVVSNSLSVPTQSAAPASEIKPKAPDLAPYLQRLCYSMQQYYRGIDPSINPRLPAVLGIALLSIPAVFIKIFKKAGFLKHVNWATADIEDLEAVPIYNTTISSSMLRLLERTDSKQVKTRRQENYQVWLSAMNHTEIKNKAQPVFPTLPIDCCPLYFPLMVKNPAKLVQALKAHDIESFNWWSHLHPSVDWQRYPVAQKLKSQIIALPLHHNMSSAQVKYAAACVHKLLITSADL